MGGCALIPPDITKMHPTGGAFFICRIIFRLWGEF